MGLYIKTQDGYEIEQRSKYSKIKYKYNNKEIDEKEFYFKKDISTVELIDLSINTIINKDLITKLEKRSIEELILPYNIEIINNYTFAYCNNLKKITLPKELETIEEYVFFDCSSLKEIELPQRLKTIEYGAFCGCSSLKNIKLPSSIEIIEKYAFGNCSNLKEITLPKKLKTIEAYAFFNCASLEKIEIPSSIENIDSNAFKDCNNIQEIIFEDESYKEKEDLQNFIKKYENKIKTKSLDDIIKNNTKTKEKELSEPDEPEI